MQKHKKRKTCKKSNKIKKNTFAPAISTSYLFELQTPDFAWKFVWTVQPNDKVQKYKKYKNKKSTKVQK